MQNIACDLETHLIKPGMLVPRMVCLSYAHGMMTGLLSREDGLRELHAWIRDPEVRLVGANIPYDLAVCGEEMPELVPLIFEAYREGRICCVQTRQKLIDVAFGMLKFRRVNGVVTKTKHSLQALAALYLNEHLEKEDTWRLKYGLLDGVPIEQWPEEARTYAINDAVMTRRVFEAQEKEIAESFEGGVLPDEVNQQRAAWALHLMGAWGIRTDPAMVERFIAESEAAIAKMMEEVKLSGIHREDGTKDTAELQRRVQEAFDRLGMEVPRTPKTDKPKLTKEVFEMTDDPALLALASVSRAQRDLGQWRDSLVAGTTGPVCARFNVLVATGRTSCGGADEDDQEASNLQNPPRKGLVRECHVARPGRVLISVDYDTAELRSLAQVCLDQFQRSRMAEMLWAQYRDDGPDLHLVTASSLLDLDPWAVLERYRDGDEEIQKYRDMSKPINFGFPGGMGLDKFMQFAWKSYGVRFTRPQAARAKDVWRATYPEMKQYLEWIGTLVNGSDEHGATIRQFRSGRIRGGVDYCSAANGFFQALTADGTKDALCDVTEECYAVPSSPLYGARPIVFLHDEVIIEAAEATAHEAAERQILLMKTAMQRWTPDVPTTCDAAITRRWLKSAKPVYVDGRRVPAKPVRAGGKTKWQADL